MRRQKGWTDVIFFELDMNCFVIIRDFVVCSSSKMCFVRLKNIRSHKPVMVKKKTKKDAKFFKQSYSSNETPLLIYDSTVFFYFTAHMKTMIYTGIFVILTENANK